MTDPLFGASASGDYPVVEPWSFAEMLRREKTALGFYVSGHPLDRYGEDLGRAIQDLVPTSALGAMDPLVRVSVAGMVEDYREKIFREGGRVCSFSLEDRDGRVFVRVPGKLVDVVSTLLASATEPVLVHGKVAFPPPSEDEEAASEEPFLLLDEVELLAEAIRQSTRHVVLRAHARRVNRAMLVELKRVLGRHPGSSSVGLVLRMEDGSEAVLSLPRELSVEASPAFVEEVEKIFVSAERDR